MNIWNEPRKYKQKSRKLAAEFSPRQAALYMPADTMKCVLTAESLGMISPDSTRLFLVERDKERYVRLCETVANTGWNGSFVSNSELVSAVIPFKLDYAWLDFNGTLTRGLGIWITNELSSNLTEGAVVCLTQEYCWRNNIWIKNVHNKTLDVENHKNLYKEFRFRHIILGDKFMSFPAYCMCCLLREWDVFVHEPFRYADTIDMVFYRFSLGSRLKTPKFPSLFRRNEMSTKSAKKAWRTRRQNAANRSNAASKAWATRRTAPVQASQVIEALSGNRRGANQLFERYIKQKVAEGATESRVRAAIKAHVTRRT